MASWFSKVFKGDESAAPTATVERAGSPAIPKPRKVVQAPVTLLDQDGSAYTDEIRIKAKIDERTYSCTFLVDRPVLEGHSCWVPDRSTAEKHAPLAKALFEIDGVAGVLIHDMTATVIREPGRGMDWPELCKAVGAEIRAFLRSGMPVVTDAFLDNVPSEQELTETLQRVIDTELNPMIAGHGGFIALNRIEGNTAYITMGGGCQGCAASSITLRQGVHAAFREAAPYLGAILDETDHAAGKNPFFRSVPTGMEG